jgi:hypothetical protein
MKIKKWQFFEKNADGPLDKNFPAKIPVKYSAGNFFPPKFRPILPPKKKLNKILNFFSLSQKSYFYTLNP